MNFRIGVDIGGTFTDIVMLRSDGVLLNKKILSTPEDYSNAIENGVRALLTNGGVSAQTVSEFAHATTVATNAIIERHGTVTALLTTRGFRDVLEMGRFRSPRLYDLNFRKPEPLVERRLRFTVSERVSATGKVLVPLDMGELEDVAEALERENIVSLAICFLNAYVNPTHEAIAADFLRDRLPNLSISVSTQLLPRVNEYERTSTTVVNAYIRPLVERYVTSLSARLKNLGITAPLAIMQSSGGILPGHLARKNPVYIIESGPAAGVVGAQRVGERIDNGNLIVFDMGGTTAKACLIENHAFELSPETEVGGSAALGHRLIQGAGYVVQVPTIDIAEVGAGGGSIASVDAAGGIRVGPRSAGASPGPICYDRGGTEPTVTDANLLLGYLNREALVGGNLRLNYTKTKAAFEKFALHCGLSLIDAAYGIHLIANASMMRALNSVSSERGRNPADFDLLAIGGNGGVHAGGLAESLRIDRIIVPPVAGLFSALGLLFADVEHQLVTAFYHRISETGAAELNSAAAPLWEEAKRLLASEGYDQRDRRSITLYADMRYVGQGSALTIPFRTFPVASADIAALADAYGEAHNTTYGYRSDSEPVQIVALKAVGRGIPEQPRIPTKISLATPLQTTTEKERHAYFGPLHGWICTPVLLRMQLKSTPQNGPAIIEEYDSTVVVRPGWRVRSDAVDNIVIERAT